MRRLENRIKSLDREIEKRLGAWEKELDLLQTVPGIDLRSACAILIEIGTWSGGVSHGEASGGVERSLSREQRKRGETQERSDPDGKQNA